MGGRNLKSQDYYIERCKATHGDKYDYSKFNYESFCKDVIIICPVHGELRECFSDINDRVIGMIESAIEECRNKAA